MENGKHTDSPGFKRARASIFCECTETLHCGFGRTDCGCAALTLLLSLAWLSFLCVEKFMLEDSSDPNQSECGHLFRPFRTQQACRIVSRGLGLGPHRGELHHGIDDANTVSLIPTFLCMHAHRCQVAVGVQTLCRRRKNGITPCVAHRYVV